MAVLHLPLHTHDAGKLLATPSSPSLSQSSAETGKITNPITNSALNSNALAAGLDVAQQAQQDHAWPCLAGWAPPLAHTTHPGMAPCPTALRGKTELSVRPPHHRLPPHTPNTHPTHTYMPPAFLQNPLSYGISWEELSADPRLDGHRRKLVTEAARELERCKMARFDERSGNLYVTGG